MLMIAVLMLSCAASCGGSTPEAPDTQNPSQITESTTEETTDGRVMDNLSDEDFGGYTFRIQANIAGNATLWAFPEEQTGDLLNDAYYKRNQQVSERFNVIFEETNKNTSKKSVKSTVVIKNKKKVNKNQKKK